MLIILAAVTVFIAVSALVLFLTSRPTEREMDRRLARLLEKPEERSAVGNVLRTDSGTFPFLRRLMAGGWADATRIQLAQAGLTLKVSEYFILRLLVGMFLGAIVLVALSGSALGLVLGGVAMGFGYILPGFIVSFLRSRRQSAIEAQLPEALSLISSSLRSGFAFTQAVELSVKQIEQPIRKELEQLVRDTSLGAPMDAALMDLSERTGSYDIEMMVSSILIQRTTGGNLSEILDNVAETVRERDRLQGEIKALTASQRFTGIVLAAYPIALWLLLTLIAPSIYSLLITEPTGRVLLVIAGTLQVFGMLTIRQILKLEV